MDFNGKIPVKDMTLYSFGAFGYMLLFMTMTTYLMYFYTDVMGIGAAAAGTIFLIARLIDAVFGPVIGSLSDKTRSKHGRYRAYVLWTMFPVAITAVLTFTVPDFLEGTQLVVYAAVAYILFDLAYSAGNIPYLSMGGSMTFDPDSRTHLLSTKTFVSKISQVLATTFTLPIVHLFVTPKAGFFYTAVIYAAIALISIYIAFRSTVRYAHVETAKKEEKHRLTLKEQVIGMVKNNQLLCIAASFLIISIMSAVSNPASIYYMRYNVGQAQLISSLMFTGTIAAILAVPLVSLLAKKLEKKTFVIAGFLMSGLASALLYFVPYDNIVLIFALKFLYGLGTGFAMILIFSMIADSVDYGEWRTGRRLQGLSFAVSVFFQKTGMALGGWLLGLGLAFIGYVPDQAQSAMSQQGILWLNSWIPAIIFALGILIMLPYNITKKKLIEFRAEIDNRPAK
ncbi:MFS transporter [Paenibacillus oralis]|uniref:MFS transporter n=1 Tax=Paenibacillus oralis TaxID=2490856 RepID=A0A3P3TXQ1_9BACL|nr:MFS transporter [Paenibacillus oralis]RRJ62496.1 MFS transporter [Paenibacillus oralis]